NKVTDGPRRMREDDGNPVYLSTVMRLFCKKAGCAIPPLSLRTGDTVGPAICQGQGAMGTNGDDQNGDDRHNPGRASSTLWYGILRPDGTIGYVNEVWIAPPQRGGLHLPACPRAF
ncbi:MAG: hypothetical protein ACRDQZ_14700, partial [Mycobacteriales bacterium]